jgi:hypothetical protein
MRQKMSVLAQCGYGRSDKIEKGLIAGVINGVIMSPRDEYKDRLEATILQWKKDYPNANIMFDPQFYATTLRAPKDGHLREYDYYNNNCGLGRTHFSSSRIHRYVQECLDYQFNIFGNKLSYLISPSIIFDDFRDYWSQVAINLAVESADYHSELKNPPPLLISIILSETALHSLDALEEFLDALTELEVDGFYLIVRHNTNSLQNAMEASSFARFMYMCYVLAEINEYKVLVGYSDWHSFLLESIGVNFTACGWYQNLRQFSLARFLPPTGGRRPRKRYSSEPLLSSPLITPELQDIYMANLLNMVLTGGEDDAILSTGPAAGEINWNDLNGIITHWKCLSSLSSQIEIGSTVADRLQTSLGFIQGAQNLYTRLEHSGISFDPTTGPQHLLEWRTAVQEFRSIVRV